MRNLVIALFSILATTLAQPLLNIPKAPGAHAQSVVQAAPKPVKAEPVKVTAPEPKAPEKPVEKPEAPKPKVEVATPAPVLDNETVIWNFLIANGFTRNQTAGIMGNLQQEHNFQTTDVAGGLGIAQWLGGRRANLIARGNHTDINVQLKFLLDELNGVESAAGTAVRASQSIEGATIAFQNLFERCGMCAQDNRITFSYNIVARH